MAAGIQKRYADANVAPPRLLYTDRDCCSAGDQSRFQRLFGEWPNLEVRLDIWHFMRRMAFGCTSESHPLFSPFLKQLSNCIFEWDSQDDLCSAICEELQGKGVQCPSNEAVVKAIKKEELGKYCRRKTRGVEATTKAIEDLILAFTALLVVLIQQVFLFLKKTWQILIRNKNDT